MSLLGGTGAATAALDIWSTGAFSFESPLKDLLDSKNYTLEQLLAEDELLQELRGLHPVLISYFSSEQSVTKLLRYITLPPSPPINEEAGGMEGEGQKPKDESGGENGSSVTGPVTLATAAQRLNRQLEKRKSGEKLDLPEKDPEFRHIRFPYMACEIICCEIDGIINTLVDGCVNEKEELVEEGKDENNTNETAVETTEPVDSSKERLLDIFFGVLYDTPAGQLDDYRAGYFDKILSLLFRKRPQELSNYINSGGGKGQQNLMEAMMKHLYSHSIMQICQRLLLPPRPTPKQEQEGEEAAESSDPSPPTKETTLGDTSAFDEEDDEAAVAGGQDILAGEEDDEAENGLGIKCDWSKSGVAIEMLLTRLINPETLLREGCQIAPVSSVETEQSIEEQRLSLSLNASEVLITVIQNSMLSSETMLSLTSLETMKRITKASTVLNGSDPFVAHESLLTSAMNVVESLILQLGGYGAVGTMSILDQAESQAMESEMAAENGEEDNSAEELPQTSGDKVASASTDPPENGQLIADLTSLLEILPEMLDGFANLLRHPSTTEWKSQVQFSKVEPVPLLGTSRLRIVRVLESLVLLGDPRIDSKLVQSDCLLICLDLFWEFQWCSMLHQSVANLLVHVFEGQNARFEIQEYFIAKCNLIGRLMNSFVEVTDPRVHGLVMDLDKVIDTEGKTSDEIKDDAVADVLPVSEDDIDAAIEKAEDEEKAKDDTVKELTSPVVENVDVVSTEAVNQESRDASILGVHAPSQSFRYGYMGHVIIICQALVQACAGNEWSGEQGDDAPQQEMEGDASEQPSVAEGMPSDDTAKTGESGAEQDPLLIAELVTNHELSERWQDFVISTLASEIAIQSTPLGGLNAQPTDPLQAHRPEGLAGRRPGLADDGDVGDGDGAMAPPPPRGMLQASEINDIDDSDLEVAASIMAGLNFGRPASDDGSTESDGAFSGSAGSGLSGNSGDSNRSYNSGETNNSGGYLFDDPLGKAGSLGIELGKLTQYRAADGKAEEAEQNNASSDDDDHSSSDEEPPRNTDEDADDDDDVPVMDLFAGNFNQAQGTETQPDSASFDFANFESAFDGGSSDDAFGNFESAPAVEPALVPEQSTTKAEDIFGSGSNSSLLDDLDDLTPSQDAPASEGDRDHVEPPPSTDPGTVVLADLDQPSSKAAPETALPPGPKDPNPGDNPAENGESDGAAETGSTKNTEPLQPEKTTKENPQKEGVLVS